MKIKLNCDLGEGFGLDAKIMKYINMANLACGYHAGDESSMKESVKLAVINSVEIGAHPAYDDKENFGRVSMSCTAEEIRDIVRSQINTLDTYCKQSNTRVSYVKPHGALYNDMARDETIYRTILDAISSYDKNIKLMILSTQNNKVYKEIASSYDISLLYEVFADRNYNDNGTLVSRTKDNAVIHDEKEVLNIIQTLKSDGYIKSINNKKLFLDVDSICVHGDNKKALEFIKILREDI